MAPENSSIGQLRRKLHLETDENKAISDILNDATTVGSGLKSALTMAINTVFSK
ncbi:hypothetical protein SK128_025660, partial [Halocaridina rubra]